MSATIVHIQQILKTFQKHINTDVILYYIVDVERVPHSKNT